MFDREMQTDLDFEEVLELKIRQSDQQLAHRKKEQHKLSAAAMEDRIEKYQRELEARYKAELEEQLSRFKDLELSKMRIEERTHHQTELSKLKLRYEEKCTRIAEESTTRVEEERQRLANREKELEKQTLTLRQTLLEQSHHSILSERTKLAEMELRCKELELENESYKGRWQDAMRQCGELEGFKERYMEKMNGVMVQYKIDLNKEHASLLSSVEVEKSKLQSERTLLTQQKQHLDTLLSEARAAHDVTQNLRTQLDESRRVCGEIGRERDEARRVVKELELQVLTRRSETALEFELQSMKKQLVEAEKMAERRQEEYQSLLQNLLTPTSTLQTDLAKSRKSEMKWQRECQQLIVKLDQELTRNEDLQRKYEDEVLKGREMRREVADLRCALHQAQSALNKQLAVYNSDDVVERRS
ncbi:hypothetical protein HK097_010925, partial [Rhizophlyctis rosea]